MGRPYLTENDEQGLRDLLIGKSVRKVGHDTLELSDGTFLRLGGNVGGCSCGAGDYDLTELNGVENIITNVAVEAAPGGDYEGEYEGHYRIFVFADNQKINLATFEGSDGNGYYGTGFWVKVVDEDDALLGRRY